MNKRKICFVITSYIHYSRNLLILEELKKRRDVDLYILIGGAALIPKYLSRYANIENALKKDGFQNIFEVYFNLEGDKGVTKAKTSGLATIEFSSIYEKIKPDLVVVRGDRFEVLSAAQAAIYMNIPVAHIEGGDSTGSIDESVRHAITKLSHIHFTTNEPATEKVLKMGENPNYVFNFGSPEIEIVKKLDTSKLDVNPLTTGSGATFDIKKNFIMIMYHSVTTEVEKMPESTRNLLDAIYELDIPAFWFWPNFDFGADEITNEIRHFKDTRSDNKIRFMRYLPPQTFIYLLKKTICFIGNSSAGIKECSCLGVPVVNVGSRQANRLRANNVIDITDDKEKIKEAVRKQISIGRYPPSNIYYADDTSKKIAETLAKVDLYIQKSFHS